MNEFWTLIAKYLFLFLIILVLSALEVQIEGKFGWTKKLPTWRIRSKIFGYFMGGKELTGYLFYLLLFIILFFHLPFFYGVPWSFSAEIEVIVLVLLFSVFWDLLWFVLNPYYGIRRLKKSYVYWHKDWILGLPLDYPRGIAVSLMFAFLDYPLGIMKWGFALSIFILGTLIVIAINEIDRKRPAYKKRHEYFFKEE